MARLLESLYREHRAIAAVLDAMQYLTRQVKADAGRADPRVFRAILYYLDVFPERHHHPKEEDFLFKALRSRTSEADALLAELREQHGKGESAIRELEQKLLRWEQGGDAEFAAFASAVEVFVENYSTHMRLEEDHVMPIAQRVLTADDWKAVETAFASHTDPLAAAGPERDPEALLRRILNLAPPPIGVGPASS